MAATGHSGGIAILWLANALDVHPVATTTQEIHCHVQVAEYYFLTNQSSKKRSKSPIYIKWHPPDYMYYKLNIDGSCCPALCTYGIGGVIRNHKSNWIIGFAGSVKEGTSIQIELLALLKDLQIAIQQRLLPIIIETDAQAIIGMLKSPAMSFINIINDCRSLLRLLDSPSVQVIYREQNCVADKLAKYGATHVQEQCLLFGTPPPFVMSCYEQDHQGYTISLWIIWFS
nr:PREDICTED: uncharacterized protein LOC104239973 [Nicotiana sylvestris]